MKLLNHYILSGFFRVLFLSLGAFVGLYLLVDFFERADDFIEHQAQVSQYLFYFALKVPMIATQVIPLAVLMSAFMTLGGLTRTNELTAMQAGGISLLRITAPLVGCALLIALAVLATNEYLVPLSTRQGNRILEVEVKGQPAANLQRERLWFREGDTLVHIRLAIPEGAALRGVSLFELDENFRLRSRIDAAGGEYSTAGWLFHDVTIREFSPESRELVRSESLPEAVLPLARTPQEFRVVPSKNMELGFRDLRALSRKLQEEGYDAIRHRVDMHSRLAAPFATVVMAFLGIPFALRKGRGASLALGITISVGIGVAFHLLNATLMALGYSGVFPPLMAAWAANFLFLLFGSWLLVLART